MKLNVSVFVLNIDALAAVCMGDVIRICVHVIRLVQSAYLILYAGTYRDIENKDR